MLVISDTMKNDNGTESERWVRSTSLDICVEELMLKQIMRIHEYPGASRLL